MLKWSDLEQGITFIARFYAKNYNSRKQPRRFRVISIIKLYKKQAYFTGNSPL